MTDTIDPTVAAVATLQLSLVIAAVVIALILQSRRPDTNQI
jgi:ABC-type spermidine/putrescine transport system permease subunit II